MKIVPKPPCFGTIEKFAYFCTKYKHTLMKELDSITQDRQDALQLMINAQLFAPSTSALAKRLGYKGKTSLYRIQQGEASAGAIEEAWDKLLPFVGGTEQQLFAAARAVGYCRNFKRAVKEEGREVLPPESLHRWVLLGVMKGDEERFSEKFQRDVWPEITDLRKEDYDAFWMMMALYYFDEEGVMVYDKDFCLLDILDKLHLLLQQNYENCERPRNSVNNIFRKEIVDACCRSCVWDLLLFGGLALMHYAAPDAMSHTIQAYTLYNLGDDSYWIAPETIYAEGARVWHLMELAVGGGRHGLYYAMELKVGRNKEEFDVIQIIPLLFNESRNYMQMEVTEKRRPLIAQYEWNEDYTALRVKASKEEHACYGLPTHLQRIDLDNPQGKEAKIWANVMKWYDKNVPDNVMQAIFQFEGMEYQDGYEIKNVAIDRHSLTITVEKEGGCTDYTIDIERYDFLKTLLPSDIIGVVHLKRTNKLSFRWIEKAYVIPIEEFEKG